MTKLVFIILIGLRKALLISPCFAPPQLDKINTAEKNKMSRHTRLSIAILILSLALGACAPAASPPAAPTTAAPASSLSPAAGLAELDELKAYVQTQSAGLHASLTRLKNASDRYFELAEAVDFDYSALWASQPEQVLEILAEAKAAFLAANPQYEQMEGVVAGVPSLSHFDVILDAGVSGAQGSEDAVPFDLTLPDGRVLPKPGNLFEVTEATLWGTDPAYVIADIHPDFNANGQVDLGDALPDANVLKGAVDTFEKYTAELVQSAAAWQPTVAEAFGALVANVPTYTDFMEGWKNSRFVMGEASSERGFVATSRLSDLSDNIISWQKIYSGLSPAVEAHSPELDDQITRDLASLQRYVADLYLQESQQGRRFTPEEADILNAEGQSRATAIAGQIAQVAAQLGVPVENQ
jgi:hypothetical protein